MHFLEVLLVVVSPNLREPGKAQYLLIEEGGKLHLPTQDLGESQSSLEVAAQLLEGLTGLKARVLGAGWVDLVPAPIVDGVNRKVPNVGLRVIAVPYGAMLPGELADLKNPDAKWVTLADAFARRDDFYMDHFDVLRSVSLCL